MKRCTRKSGITSSDLRKAENSPEQYGCQCWIVTRCLAASCQKLRATCCLQRGNQASHQAVHVKQRHHQQ